MATTFHMCGRFVRNFYGLNRAFGYLTPNNLRFQLAGLSSEASETKPEDNSTPPDKESTPEHDIEAKFKEEKDALTKSLTEVEDKYKRALAETENVRNRLKKQVEDAKLFGIQGFCKDLLDVADILGRATESVPKESLTSCNQELKTLYDGLVMTEGQLVKVFSKHGLCQINPEEGTLFDPNFHEAMFQLPKVDGKNAGTVASVQKIGYQLHNRTIRPALVGVYKDP